MTLTPAKRPPPTDNEESEEETDAPQPYNPFFSLSPATYVKSKQDLGGIQKITGLLPAQLFLRDVAFGLYTLLYINKYASNTAAYSWPLTKVCETKPNFPNFRKYQHFLDIIGMLAFMPRRVSKAKNEAIYTAPNSDGGTYRELLYVLQIEDKSRENKKAILRKIKDFLHEEKVACEIAPNFNITHPTKQSLDNYIEDRFVLRLIHLTLKRESIDQSFYLNNSPTLRAAFFSKPYPPESASLGYPVKTSDLDESTTKPTVSITTKHRETTIEQVVETADPPRSPNSCIAPTAQNSAAMVSPSLNNGGKGNPAKI